MSFLAPYVLWGSLAAGIPIAIHFFFKSRFRTVPWAAMEFLLQAVEETSRRVKFQELLLLIARVVLLLLLALALARPTSRVVGGASDGDAVDAVILLDNSMSMDAREGGRSRLDRAKHAARAIVDHLPPHSSVQVITNSDRADIVGPRRPTDFDSARELIDGIAPSARGSDLGPGIRAALDPLRRGAAPNKELYVFSDFQAFGWDKEPTPLVESLRDAQKLGTVYFARCGTTVPRNAVVLGIAPQTGVPHTGERVGFAVLIKNAGLETLRDLTVTLTADGDDKRRETQPLAKLEPGETRAVTLSAQWNEAGLHRVTARVQADDLSSDDVYDQVLRIRDKVRVLVVDGAPAPRDPEKASSFFLLHALLPVKDVDKPRYHIQPRLVSPAQTATPLLADQDVCILVNVAVEPESGKAVEVLPPDFAEALARFVRDGKTLLIFAGDRTKSDAYNRVFLERLKLLPLKLAGIHESKRDAEVALDRRSAGDPAFWKFRDDENYQTFTKVKTTKYLKGSELAVERADDPRSAAKVLLRYTDGQPAIVLRQVGAGSVALVTTTADASWSDMPMQISVFVPLVDALVTQMLIGGDDLHNAPAGRGLKWFAAAGDADRPFALLRPDGKRVRLGSPEPVQGRPRVTAADTPIAGLYRILPADAPETEGVPFAVTPESAESLAPETLPVERLDERLGFKPVHLNVTDDVTAFTGPERTKREWTPWLLRCLLALALGESLFAWFCGRSK